MAAECKKVGGLWVRAIEEPTFHQKMWGLWVTADTISKNKGSLGDSSTENRGSFEPYIRFTSIMGVPPGDGTVAPSINQHVVRCESQPTKAGLLRGDNCMLLAHRP